ncbi:hypothetical protein [Nonomuraea sp. NPDC050783]|uniref:hypothetical protein n=1 Tax=Nonomuraea sp. NPDC050783 TaxID=3154634 RepID=UPI003464F441
MTNGNARRAMITGAVFAAALGVTSPGSASTQAADFDNMYPTEHTSWVCRDQKFSINAKFCQTDNSTLTVWRQDSISIKQGRQNIAAVLKTEFHEGTDLTVKFVRKPVYAGSKETDVIYQKAKDPKKELPGLQALTWCNDAVNDTRCDQHYVRFHTAWPSKTLVCHETGHAVGLTHGSNASPRVKIDDYRLACMRYPFTAGAYLGAHNVKMINKTY